MVKLYIGANHGLLKQKVGLMRTVLSGNLIIICIFFLAGAVAAQDAALPLPVIDIHLHASPADNNGPPPTGICAGAPGFPAHDPGTPWLPEFLAWAANPPCDDPIWGPETDREVMEQTLEILYRRNIYGVTSGRFLADYIEHGGGRIMPSLSFGLREGGPSPERVREQLESGAYRVVGEIGTADTDFASQAVDGTFPGADIADREMLVGSTGALCQLARGEEMEVRGGEAFGIIHVKLVQALFYHPFTVEG